MGKPADGALYTYSMISSQCWFYSLANSIRTSSPQLQPWLEAVPNSSEEHDPPLWYVHTQTQTHTIISKNSWKINFKKYV